MSMNPAYFTLFAANQQIWRILAVSAFLNTVHCMCADNRINLQLTSDLSRSTMGKYDIELMTKHDRKTVQIRRKDIQYGVYQQGFIVQCLQNPTRVLGRYEASVRATTAWSTSLEGGYCQFTGKNKSHKQLNTNPDSSKVIDNLSLGQRSSYIGT